MNVFDALRSILGLFLIFLRRDLKAFNLRIVTGILGPRSSIIASAAYICVIRRARALLAPWRPRYAHCAMARPHLSVVNRIVNGRRVSSCPTLMPCLVSAGRADLCAPGVSAPHFGRVGRAWKFGVSRNPQKLVNKTPVTILKNI